MELRSRNLASTPPDGDVQNTLADGLYPYIQPDVDCANGDMIAKRV